MKAFLILNDIDFPKTHDVDFLLIECQKIGSVNFQFVFMSLTEFGVTARYPDDFYIPGVVETQEYIEFALDVKAVVEKLICL